MAEKLLKFLKRNFFVSVLILITVILAWKNYTPGTWLIGWDSLHPEFDFLLNLKRILFGVWREEQGLGALAVHAHISELPRIILLAFSSIIFPDNFLRYFFFFLTLLLGPLGIYYFLKQVIFNEKAGQQREIVSSLGGLFYLLNLGTLQHFHVPFEMFAVQYAALPWLFLFASKFLKFGKGKSLIAFALVSFVSSSMAYASALWFVYFISFFFYCLAFFLGTRNITRVMVILATTLLINAYWLLPNLYFTVTGSQIVQQAKINQLFSDKAYLEDSKFATVENAAIFKSFLFDWQEYNKGEFSSLLASWQKHLGNPVILFIGYQFSLVILFGIFSTFIKKKKEGLFLLLPFLFAFIFLIHNQPPINLVFSLFRNNDLFREGLRFPWTKFSLIVMLGGAVYFSIGIASFLNFLKNKIFTLTFFVFFSGLLVIWMAPAFSGNFIDPHRRIKLPEYYQTTFNWFKDIPVDNRIAIFPIPSFWGWEYRDWGFEGAGFVWFGLKQPVLTRDFDRWNPSNENFYWEASHAVYSKNPSLLGKVLEKYQVHWLLVDQSTINPSFPRAVNYEQLEEMFGKSNKIHLAQTFGKIKIYQVDLETPMENYVFLAKNLPVISPSYNWTNLDQAYFDNGNYVSNPNYQLPITSYYPFRSLFTGRSQDDLEFQVEDRGGEIVFTAQIPEPYQNFILEIPPGQNEELPIIDPNNLTETNFVQPDVSYDNQTIEVRVPKMNGFDNVTFAPPTSSNVQEAVNCNQFSKGSVKNELTPDGNLRLTAIDATNCSEAFSLAEFPHNLAYLISVESRNVKGKPLIFWIENLTNRKADLETYLPKSPNYSASAPLRRIEASRPSRDGQLPITNYSYFVQPPMASDGLGYALHFDNVSIGQFESVNDLGKVTVNPIPFKFLTQIKLVSPESQETQITQKVSESVPNVSHPNPSLYEFRQLPITNYQLLTLVLSQSYHSGWQAYTVDQNVSGFLAPVLGKKIGDHVLVNNWQNGWRIEEPIPKNQKIVIFFLPQYLEFIGFVLLLTPLLLFTPFFRKRLFS